MTRPHPRGLGELPGTGVDIFSRRVTKRAQRTLILLVATLNVSNVLGGDAHGTAAWAGQELAVILAVAQGVALWWVNRRPGWAAAVAILGDGGLILTLDPNSPQEP